jgi:hypothetical protein
MDMDELTRYVFRNYSSLLTPLEADGFRRILDDTMDRVRAESDLPAEHMIELEIRRWVYASVFSGRIEVSMDALRFMERVRDRVLRDHADEVLLNRCPRCDALARLPTARLCRYCHYDWHEAAPSGPAAHSVIRR